MEKQIYGIVYMIKNKVNGKIYFGVTTSERGYKGRYSGNLLNSTHNTHLKKSIKKYGVQNFEINEQFDVAYSKQELDALEDLYICMYNTIDPKYGYNKKRGGDTGKYTQESRKKLSESRKGIRFTEQHKQHISDTNWLKGAPKEKHPFYGKHHTEQAKEKNRQAHLGKQRPQNEKEQIRKTCGERFGKPVLQYDKNNNFIARFPSRGEAARQLGIDGGSIASCANGKRKSAGGYIWKWDNIDKGEEFE